MHLHHDSAIHFWSHLALGYGTPLLVGWSLVILAERFRLRRFLLLATFAQWTACVVVWLYWRRRRVSIPSIKGVDADDEPIIVLMQCLLWAAAILCSASVFTLAFRWWRDTSSIRLFLVSRSK